MLKHPKKHLQNAQQTLRTYKIKHVETDCGTFRNFNIQYFLDWN